MDNLDPLRFVKFYASVKHAGQEYSLGQPYVVHLKATDDVLVRFGVTDLVMRTAAWLHDVIEDQGVTARDIAEMFGEEVATLVAAVTNEEGPNRKARGLLTYPKIRKTPRAVQLKLADRIANVENGGRMVQKYREEYEDFRRALYVPGEYENMWQHLDKLLS